MNNKETRKTIGIVITITLGAMLLLSGESVPLTIWICLFFAFGYFVASPALHKWLGY